jgi:hypothetical protein
MSTGGVSDICFAAAQAREDGSIGINRTAQLLGTCSKAREILENEEKDLATDLHVFVNMAGQEIVGHAVFDLICALH